MTTSLTVLALGCPAQPDVEALPAVAPFQSGTRLRAMYLDVEGLRVARGFFDTTLGVACAFSELGAADGRHYCLPTHRSKLGAGRWFADAACTERLVDTSSCDEPDYLVVGPSHACTSEVPSVYAVAVAPATSAAGESREGCFYFDGTQRRRFFRGQPIPISAFASARETTVSTGGRISVLTLQTEDGARIRLAGWDTRRGEDVHGTATSSGDGPRPWMPIRVARVGRQEAALFDDAACTQEVVATDSCAPSAVVDIYDSINSVHEIGRRVSGPTYVLDERGACLPTAAPPGGSQIYEIGRARPAATLEPSRTVEVGTGRLRALYGAGLDGIPIQAESRYRDTARGEECSFISDENSVDLVLSDGTIRCLPVRAFLQGGRAAFPHGSPPPRDFTTWESGGCVTPIVFAVGPYYSTDGQRDFYDVAGTVPLDAFAIATPRVD